VSTSKTSPLHRSDADRTFRCKLQVSLFVVLYGETGAQGSKSLGVGSHTHKTTHLTPARNRRQYLTNVLYFYDVHPVVCVITIIY
jgi:hypothetical protein